jgi:polar amino acid transport system substrate-binding protein
MTDPPVVADLAPIGVLRASINLGNPVLAQGPSDTDGCRVIAARAPRRSSPARRGRRW